MAIELNIDMLYIMFLFVLFFDISEGSSRNKRDGDAKACR